MPRIKIPEQAATGDIIEVKALINHVMETGNRNSGEEIDESICAALA